ncbi:AAA family ATPase [Lentilactobacillus sp. SPB1-3]|uniref:AAA family ATPase n=1 Tax=Lentilactobacillus terminaliae TaxID=3003483 RepID=A0ACD5DH38_9LACO|nr:AAA family ATPase [Lentilactobacillus sp. SPB1-3]MCZ0977064.1 AAA family ATPase [Lentilactobacillus sp. SPB1-3]
MIIQKLEIYGYGKWSDQTIELNAPIQMIIGANEAGKSTIVDFIKSILFGFQTSRQAVHGKYIPKDGSKYGGEIYFEESNQQYRVIRTKGTHGGKVRFFNLSKDIELTKEDFEEMIAPIDRDIYDNLFYFGEYAQSDLYKMDITELRQRIQELGVTGANKLFDLSADFDSQASAMFAKKGTKRQINQKLRDYDQLSKQVDEAKENFAEYQQLTNDIQIQSQKNGDLQSKLKTEQSRLSKLESQARTIPLLTELQQLPEVNQSDLKDGFSDKDKNQFAAYLAEKNQSEKEFVKIKDQLTDPQLAVTLSPAATFYRQNEGQITDLLLDAVSIQDKVSHLTYNQESKNSNQEKINSLMSEHNLVDPLPAPFDEETKQKVSGLLDDKAQAENYQQSRSTNKQTLTITNPMMLGIGVLIAIIGLFMSSVLVKLIGIVAGAAFAYYFGIGHSKAAPDKMIDEASVQARLDDIGRKFELGNIPEDEWLPIQNVLSQINDLQNEIEQLTTASKQIDADVKNYFNQWQFANDWLAMSAGAPYSERLEVIRTSVSRWQKESNESLATENKLTMLQNMLTEQQAGLDKINATINHFLTERQLTKSADFDAEYARQQVIEKQLAKRQQLTEQIQSAKVTISADNDLDALQNQVETARKDISELQASLNENERAVTEKQIRLDHLVRDGEYQQLNQQLENMKAEIVADVHSFVALSTSAQFIGRVLDIASKGRLPKILNQATEYFGLLTNGKYKKIDFDDSITVTSINDYNFEINELSRGTLEQLYLSLVLSMAVNFADTYPMPIVIDDGFVNFDSQRRQNAYQLLNKVAERTQVIYLTANEPVEDVNIAQLKI